VPPLATWLIKDKHSQRRPSPIGLFYCILFYRTCASALSQFAGWSGRHMYCKNTEVMLEAFLSTEFIRHSVASKCGGLPLRVVEFCVPRAWRSASVAFLLHPSSKDLSHHAPARNLHLAVQSSGVWGPEVSQRSNGEAPLQIWMTFHFHRNLISFVVGSRANFALR